MEKPTKFPSPAEKPITFHSVVAILQRASALLDREVANLEAGARRTLQPAELSFLSSFVFLATTELERIARDLDAPVRERLTTLARGMHALLKTMEER